MKRFIFINQILTIFFLSVLAAASQTFQKDFPLKSGGAVEIANIHGRVTVQASEANEDRVFVSAISAEQILESDIKIESSDGKIKIQVLPKSERARIDLTLKLPNRSRVRIETREGEVLVGGNLEAASVSTETGTIAADVALDNLKYDFVWTASSPRVLSDVPLEEIKEGAAGRFSIKGKIINQEALDKLAGKSDPEENSEEASEEDSSEDGANGEADKSKEKKQKKKKPKKNDNRVELNFQTARGIVLLNVKPGEVPSNLRERPLTEAAKAVIRSGDSILTEAIRRASPKFFGDYAKTLPPRKALPSLSEAKPAPKIPVAAVKRVLVRVVDINNRAIPDLQAKDFEVTENGEKREILSIEQTTAPFNLVLLLDVSGSVENYVDFIRKAARNFINTVGAQDRVAIVLFNEDVKTLSTFTTDKGRLSESLDTFDAGGSTAFYDALAYTLTETLRPMKGERTAIVVLSDGDDNRSFLPFEPLLGSIQESGALIYPLYVPSGLIAASATNNPNQTADPLRTRYLSLTSKAENEGERLAQVSGGVYYPITRLSDLQTAYDDIVRQLRTAYSVTFRSETAETRERTNPLRLKVKVNRDNSFVKLGSVVEVPTGETSRLEVEKNRKSSPRAQMIRSEVTTADIAESEFNFAAFSPSRAPSFFLNANFDPSRRAFSYNQTAEISGSIENIKYKQLVNDKLREYKLENFDINKATGAFVLSSGKDQIAVSRWISPKRTRSYPYERVYDTLAFAGKKVAVIPVVKDEGLGGDRDFLQWDTISLLSLLGVYIVPAYYSKAEKNPRRNDQITAQKFDNSYVLSRLNEIFNFKGTPREWNEREAKELKAILEKAKLAYREISKNTKTYLHDETALDELIKFAATPEKFIEFSRQKAQNAQNREFNTLQPKEALSTDSKGKVTITNALFGKYFFTVDETKIEPKTVHLIEAKHSQRAKMPSRNDIKDGLVKMMVYTNLKNVKLGSKPVDHKVGIRLTSAKLEGSITSNAADEQLEKFCSDNSIDAGNTAFLKKLFQEARDNNFTIILEKGETAQ